MFDWRPFELRPYPTPTLRSDGDYLQKAWQQSVYPLAQRLGVEIHLPTVSPQPYTRLAHEGLEYARVQGRADAFNDAVFRAFFQRSEDIGQAEVLAELAGSVVLNASDFREALDSHTYADVVRQHLRQAEALGITAVPTMFIGRRALAGLYPEETLAEVIEQELKVSNG